MVKPNTCIRKTATDERERDGHHGNEGGSQGTEKQKDDDHHDQQRFGTRVLITSRMAL
jgi:hypothetical protein